MEMKSTMFGRILVAAALLAGTGFAGSAGKQAVTAPQDDATLAKSVRHEVLMYPYYSIWDDISYRVDNGNVALLGAVNQPFKKSDIEKRVRSIPGVTGVTDEIKVLPLSTNDDRLRLQIARAIYRDPVLSRYGIQPVPPIHIIVENGHVTLAGIVNTDMEKE